MTINSSIGDRVFVSWSGGKDSYLAFLKAKEQGLQPVCLLSFVGDDGQSRSHGLKTVMLQMQADALNIPLVTETVTWAGYEQGFEQAVKKLKKDYQITGGVFGDINLPEHRDWVKKMADRCAIDYNLPLWQMEELAVAEELVRRGAKAMIVAIRSDLVDQSWLGRFLDQDYINYCLSIGISPCGEGGEAHTLVVDGPLFSNPLEFSRGEITRLEKHALLSVDPVSS